MIEKILRVIKRYVQVAVEDVKMKHELIEDLGMNECDIIDMVVELEQRFGIEIYEEIYQQWVTVEDVIKYVEKVKNGGK